MPSNLNGDDHAVSDLRVEINGLSILIKAAVFQRLPYAADVLAEDALAADVLEGAFTESVEPSAPLDLLLDYNVGGAGETSRLVLQWHRAEQKKPLLFDLDYVKQASKIRSFPAPKQGAFNQALGKKSRVILDATGGWGGDAFLMATQGYKVHVVERNPLMAVILMEAFERLARFWSAEGFTEGSAIVAPSVIWADGINWMQNQQHDLASDIDCVYLDPMFPPKRKKSAATNKQMQLLHLLVGHDLDAEELLSAALASGAARMAVKRPDYADALLRAPCHQFSSKLVHYDVYLPASTAFR